MAWHGVVWHGMETYSKMDVAATMRFRMAQTQQKKISVNKHATPVHAISRYLITKQQN